MTWYDGGKKPSAEGSHVPNDDALPDQGVLLIGEKGSLVCAHGKRPVLYPFDQYQESDTPRRNGIDHYGEWIECIRTGDRPGSDFSYAGPLTETVLLGVIASRIGSEGGELLWDAEALRVTNSDKANRFVKEDYRTGWTIEGLS